MSPTIYAIGKYLFQLGGSDSELLAQTRAAYVPFDSTSWAKQQCLTDPDFNPVPDTVSVDYIQQQFQALAWHGSVGGFVIWVINDRAQQHHTEFCPNQLAIEAALLVTPAGRPVWLSGGTHAGKSTLTVALALGLGWKVISEDFVYLISACLPAAHGGQSFLQERYAARSAKSAILQPAAPSKAAVRNLRGH